MPIKIIDNHSKEHHQMIGLRNEVLRQPLGLQLDDQEFTREAEDILIGYFEEDTLLGCCILTNPPGEPLAIKLRQMAVRENSRGQGVGRQLLHFAENMTRHLGHSVLMMHARQAAVGFYEKSGYSIVGDPFEEVTIPHYRMEKNLGSFLDVPPSE
jgi:predicted GNAT family N-acyltransferase